MTRKDDDWEKKFEELISSQLSDALPTDLDDMSDRELSTDNGNTQVPPDSQPRIEHTPQRCIAVILTPVQDETDLVALLAVNRLDALVIHTDTGAIVYQECRVEPGNEFEELLGDDRPVPEEAERMAKVVSSMMSYYGAILCVSWLQDAPDETSQLCGQVIAKRYVNQEFDANLPSGQLISALSSSVEDLLLGLITPEELEKKFNTKNMSTFQALRYLRRRVLGNFSGVEPDKNKEE
ncbi:MAG: hypothetical protein Q4P66_01750 [Actinomycetaceae bacterium]|nr:hypothetical protein [Actinomycetaceae bacterium]